MDECLLTRGSKPQRKTTGQEVERARPRPEKYAGAGARAPECFAKVQAARAPARALDRPAQPGGSLSTRVIPDGPRGPIRDLAASDPGSPSLRSFGRDDTSRPLPFPHPEEARRAVSKEGRGRRGGGPARGAPHRPRPEILRFPRLRLPETWANCSTSRQSGSAPQSACAAQSLDGQRQSGTAAGWHGACEQPGKPGRTCSRAMCYVPCAMCSHAESDQEECQ